MSITSRINEMSTHIEQAYDELQGLGADLTNVNKNIENISMVLDDIYDSMPQVSGEGTSLTLDDTRVGKIKSTLKGNTSQTTYSGKNMFSTSMLPVTEYGITISKNANGDIVLNGTPNYNEGFKTFYTGDVITVEGGTYTLSVANKKVGIGTVVGGFNGGCNLTLTDTATSKTAYADTPQNVNPAINIRYDVGTLNNFILNPQMEKSSSATTYEQFVGGTASPNPSYPQPINVVSGDNEINVCGKNLFNKADYITDSWESNRNGWVLNLEAGTYTLSANVKLKMVKGSEHNSTSWANTKFGASNVNANTFTFTINENFNQYLWFSYTDSGGNEVSITKDNISSLNIQLEQGSSASEYEPYQGNTYNIDLPVENLLQCNIVSTTTGGVTITNNNDESFTLQGTSTAGIGRDIHGEITLKAGTYTFSADHLPAGVYISLANVSNTILNRATPSRKFTISTDTTYAKCLLWIDSGYTVNDTIKIQLEKGSKQNNFTPYGTTPIELCKIGNYQDYFGKSDGRNLCNGINQSVYLNNDVNRCGVASGDSGLYIPVNGGQYTISTLVTQTRYRVACSNDLPPSVSSAIAYNGQNKDNTSNSITINTTGYNYLIVNATDLSAIQIEKGSNATNPQPYGVGKWYLHKEIGKVILDGSETISNYGATSLSGSYQATFEITTKSNSTDKIVLSDYFTSALLSERTTKTNIIYSYSDGLLRIATNIATTMEDFKTWLSTHNTIAYFVLATPTNIEVEYQPLIDQLNLLEKAISYDSQTNISQVNNDLPFIISASALKEWQESTSLNSTLSMVNPLSLGNTLNTQDNTQPIEVDNIEPLEEEENEES